MQGAGRAPTRRAGIRGVKSRAEDVLVRTCGPEAGVIVYLGPNTIGRVLSPLMEHIPSDRSGFGAPHLVPAPAGGMPPAGPPPGSPLRDPNPHFGYPVDRGAQLREWLNVAYRGRWIIAATLVAVLVPTLWYASTLQNQYRAETVLLVETGDASELSNVLPSAAAEALGGGKGRKIENEVLRLRRSDVLFDATAEQLLAERSASPAFPLLRDEAGAVVSRDVVAARLRNTIAVAPEGRDLDAIRISVASTSPEEAATVANVYAQQYIGRARNGSRASVRATRTFLETQVDSLSNELVGREEAVREYMTREGAIRLDDEASRLVEQIASLEAQRDEAAIAGRLRGASASAIGGEIARVAPRMGERIAARVESGSTAEIEAVQAEIRRLQTELEPYYLQNPELRNAPTGSVPDFIERRRSQIAAARRRADGLASDFAQNAVASEGTASEEGIGRVTELRRRRTDAQIEQSGFEAQSSTITGRLAQYESQLSRIPSQAVELARLTRARQSTEGLMVALQERLQEARVAEQSELGYAEVISAADTPGLPFEPNRRRIAILGLLFGLGAGVGLALLRVRLDHRLHRPESLRERGITVLGTIPDTTPLVAKDFGGAETVTIDGRSIDTHLTVLLVPLAQASEAYRGLRTSVQFSRPDVVVQTILVTSASPGEGKSTTAANLALTMAQAGRRVLLVDADLRRPRQHSLFGLSRTPGVSDVLFQPVEAGLLPPGLAPSGVEDLDVLAAGVHAPNPSELLGSRAFRDRLAAWAEGYDAVIIDAPPVLAATDAVLLSTQVDATIVVVRAGKTKDFELDRALEQLKSVGAPVIGTVFNGFDSTHAYGYKYRYTTGYSTYGYGYAESLARQDEA